MADILACGVLSVIVFLLVRQILVKLVHLGRSSTEGQVTLIYRKPCIIKFERTEHMRPKQIRFLGYEASRRRPKYSSTISNCLHYLEGDSESTTHLYRYVGKAPAKIVRLPHLAEATFANAHLG